MQNNNKALKILDKTGEWKLSFLHSAKSGKSIIGINESDSISTEKIEDLKEFSKKNKDKLIIGYISYDTCYELLEIKQHSKDDINLPKIHFKAYKEWIEIEENKVIKGKKLYEKIYKLSNQKSEPKNSSKNFKATITKAKYDKAYKQIQKYIEEGDIYQVNLTHRLEGESKANPRKLFKKVIAKNPVNHLAYIEGEDFEILSASPERFIRINKNIIETKPVKGTRPRGKTEKEDRQMQKELIESKKEAAELNMITDLLRNDLGKIAKTGTVKVEGHRLLQECPTVWHTYSKLTAEIKVPAIEALLSMLPGGSITGCPKKRAVEIIDELEEKSRGVYTGIIGYIKPNQDLDFSIAIRTLIKKGEKVYLQVGGGIVLDSSTKAEYQETLDKAKSFMEIL